MTVLFDLVSGNTTNFRAHLTRDHEAEVGHAKHTQPKIKEFVGEKMKKKSVPLPGPRQEEICEAIGDYIVHSLLPLSMVEDTTFRNLLAALEPRFQPPCTATMLTKLKKKKEATKLDILTEIKGKDLAITHDGWTSLNTEGYETVTGSYINDKWKLNCKVLDTVKVEGSHSAENIAAALTRAKQRWLFGNTVATTDNASNEVKAFKLLGWHHFSCLGHNLNLVVNAGLTVVSRIIAKGRAVVSYFHRSPLAMGFLFEKQKLLLEKNAQGHKLIIDCPTRWNSSLAMLERLVEQTAALHAVVSDARCKNTDLKSKLYSYEEQSTVESIISVLKPFHTATIIMSSESKPTISLVLPTLIKLERVLSTEDDADIITRMKAAMAKNLEKRKNDKSLEFYRLASLVDPRTKALGFLDDEDKAKARQFLLEKCMENFDVPQLNIKREKEDEAGPDMPVLPMPQNGMDHGSDGPEALIQESHEPLPSEIAKPELPMLFPYNHDNDQELKSENDLKLDPAELETEPLQKVPKLEDVDSPDWLNDVVVCQVESPKFSPMEICVKEVDRFIADEPQISQKDDPLEWWAKKEPIFPTVAQVAKSVLAIPASSVPSERIFSLAGMIVTKKRSQLSPENVDLLIFLNKNLKQK